jgi:hypothetical protein
MYESMRHLLEIPTDKKFPEAKLDGSLWLDKSKNELNTYDKTAQEWKNVFSNKFQIVDQIMTPYEPTNPVPGQLWLCSGVLMYYDGTQWQPVKAVQESDAQFNLSIFSNFTMASPLWTIGNTVLESKDSKLAYLNEYQEAVRKVQQGKIDAENDAAEIGHEKQWDVGDVCGDDVKYPYPTSLLEGYSQMLIPNADMDRIFVDDKLDFSFRKQSSICIEYPKKLLVDHTPSLIHINPGRLNHISKRLFKVDPINPKINIDTKATEFYGFCDNHRQGHYLRPEDNKGKGDYRTLSDGIYLSKYACDNYGYVLAIAYDFTWYRNSGDLAFIDNQGDTPSYYIKDYTGTMSVFVEGLNLDDNQYTEDNTSRVLTVKSNGNEVTGAIHAPKQESGYIREISLNNQGVIHLVKSFTNPLVFVNGELLNPIANDYIKDGQWIYVPNASINMMWNVIESHDEKNSYDMLAAAGKVTDKAGTNAIIKYDPKTISPEEDIALFINGLLIKKVDVTRDIVNNYITVSNLQVGQDYIILKDKYHYFYSEEDMTPAIPIGGTVSQCIVYYNGLYLGDSTQVFTTASQADAATTARHNEVRYFLSSEVSGTGVKYYVNGVSEATMRNSIESYMDGNRKGQSPAMPDASKIAGQFMIYDEPNGVWKLLPAADIMQCLYISDGYDITPHAAKLNFTPTEDDDIKIYGYRYAHDSGQTLFIRNLPSADGVDPKNLGDHLIYDHYKTDKDGKPVYFPGTTIKQPDDGAHLVVNGETIFNTEKEYIPNIGALSVWVNGVRQYDVIEAVDGKSFTLPEPVCGIVTYCIETPEKGRMTVCQREILTEDNAIADTPNVYRTKRPLYPGRVILYIDGVRQPQDSFTAIDNYTLAINDPGVMLVGSNKNYPNETIMVDGKTKTLTHHKADRLLVEVRQDYSRKEQTIKFDPADKYDIQVNKYNLSEEILESTDEIMIFVNGLFYGTRDLISYRLDKYRNTITLLDVDIVDKIISDPLYSFLMNNPAALAKYEKLNGGKPYILKPKMLTIDWR